MHTIAHRGRGRGVPCDIPFRLFRWLRNGHDEADYAPPEPELSTATLVGSVERVQVMRERYERGEHLYHPHDSIGVCPESNIEKIKKLVELQYPDGIELPKYKKCTNCEEVKETKHFQMDYRRRDGLVSWCRQCANKYSRERKRFLKHGSSKVIREAV